MKQITNYLSGFFRGFLPRKVRIKDPICDKLAERYALVDPKNLTHLIIKLNDDDDFSELVKRNGSQILLGPPSKKKSDFFINLFIDSFGSFINLNYSPNDKLHLRYWNSSRPMTEDKIVPVRKDEDIKKFYSPMTAEDLRMTVVSYIIKTDKKISEENKV